MPKSSKTNKNHIRVGDVIGSNIVIGHNNIINFSEVIKAAYGLFTIPAPVADFTGREKELAQLKKSFLRGAIITGLSGAGGIGKTELARKLAHDIAENFPDAQINIDLQGTSEKPLSSDDAMRRLLEPFFIGQKLPDDEYQLKGLYHQTFGRKKILLLLDNAANATQIRPLIPSAPSAAIITSRQHFSLTEFGLHEPLRLDVLSPQKARDFLRSSSPKIKDSPVEEINELAKLCGYLPLALRVVISLLNDRPDWMTGHLVKRLADERTRLQQLKREDDVNLDVESALSLSYKLLSDNLKKRFRELGIFTASFVKISAKEVLKIEDDNELDDIFGKLIGRNLLSYQKSQEIIEDQYSMHDLTRLYATQKLLEENEYEEGFAQYARHFLEWANETNDLYKKGNKSILVGLTYFRFIWIHLYSIYNRLLSVQKSMLHPLWVDQWLSSFPGACVHVFELHIPPQERSVILQTALDAACRLGNNQEKQINLGNLGIAYNSMGNSHQSIELFLQAIKIAREIEDRWHEGNWTSNLGIAYKNLGNARKAIEFYEKALFINREIGNRRGEGFDLNNLGLAYTELGDMHKAIELSEQALAINREIGNRRSEGASLSYLGLAYAGMNNIPKAIEYYKNALIIDRELGDRRGEGIDLGNLGIAYKNLGDSQKSIKYYKQALAIAHEIGDRRNEASWLGNLGTVYGEVLGNAKKAIEFYNQQLAIVREIGNQRGEGAALANMGMSYKIVGEKNKARSVWQEALHIFNVIESPHTKTIEGWLDELDKE